MLIVRLDAIGDALTTVPLLAALSGRGMRVGALLTGANAAVFAAGALARVHVAGHAGVLSEITRERYDVALIPSEEPEAYAIARDAGIPRRVGFDNGLWGKPFKTLWIRSTCTRTVYRNAGLDHRKLHECEIVFELARDVLPGESAPRDPAVLRPLVLDSDVARNAPVSMQITQKWERLGAEARDVSKLATSLASSRPMRFIGAAAEKETLDAFERATSLPVERFEEMGPWKSAVAQSAAIVAPDSGATHVAGITGTPVAACFAPHLFDLQVARWRPWAAPSIPIAIQNGWIERAENALAELLDA